MAVGTLMKLAFFAVNILVASIIFYLLRRQKQLQLKMLVQITGAYREETVVNIPFCHAVLNNLQANFLLILYISPSHSLMRATS